MFDLVTHANEMLAGIAAIQAAQPTHTLFGRRFKVMATFDDTDEGTRAANAYMEANEGAAVLDVIDGKVILAHQEDKGVEIWTN